MTRIRKVRKNVLILLTCLGDRENDEAGVTNFMRHCFLDEVVYICNMYNDLRWNRRITYFLKYRVLDHK